MTKVIPIYTQQNVDRIITPKDFQREDLKGKLLVTSIFYTIQGEGTYAGWPAVFLRLSGCNFGDKQDHCQWCDTSFQYDNGKAMTYEEILDQAQELTGDAVMTQQHVVLVVTGGEPTLQHNLVEFIEEVQDHFYDVQIETNGTQAAFFKLLPNSNAQPFVCVSPKASYKAERYPKPSDHVLQYVDDLKFVLEVNPNSPHHTVPDWAFELFNDRMEAGNPINLMVSPMAVYTKPYQGEVSSIWTPGLIDHDCTAANYAYAANYALEHRIRISVQQHLFLGIA